MVMTIIGNEIQEESAILHNYLRFLVDIHAIDNDRHEVAIQQERSALRVYSFNHRPENEYFDTNSGREG